MDQTVSITPGFEPIDEYDDAGFTVESNNLISAVGGMMAAGASSKDIAEAVSNGIENYA
jgi:hypothetical protein